MGIVFKVAIWIIILTILLSANDFIRDLKQGNADSTKPTQESTATVQNDLSPDEYITRFKNGKPKNASETVDELFRRNYGAPRYKYKEENGEKYVLVRADSTSRCETVTFYFQISGNDFIPTKCILRDQVQFKDNYLGKEEANLILNTIFKTN